AGLRIGWVAARDAELCRRLAAFKHYTTICNSGPSEILALMGLRARDVLVERARRIVMANLARLDRFFDGFAGPPAWVRPRAGTVAFPRLLGATPIERVAEELAAVEGTLIVPGSIFDWPGNHFRIGFGRENVPEALARFERHLRRMRGG